jgi:hypothetical protein
MPNRNVYVSEADLALWERAARYAKRERRSMSELIMIALEEYLERHG